jgi:P2-related tail formation protein
MSTFLTNAKTIDNCTISISYDKQVQSACPAFDYQMLQIVDETGQVVFVPNIMNLKDSNLVNILAWQFHVDFYDQTRDIEFRKRLVQISIIWHKTKGTYALVQDVLDTYWPGGATLTEWFDYEDPLPPPRPPNSSGPLPEPNWHDRYRFRIYIDEQIIAPSDEQQVLNLINHYKPISRWCEGIFRARTSQCNIGWCGMMLRFIYRTSEAPDYQQHRAESYELNPPATSAGMAAEWSEHFSVALPPDAAVVDAPVTITPNDNGAGGVFIPPSVVLTTDVPVAKFQYNAPAITGTVGIYTTNDGGLIDPPVLTYSVSQRVYTLTGPSTGAVGEASTPFTVTLEP